MSAKKIAKRDDRLRRSIPIEGVIARYTKIEKLTNYLLNI